VCQIQTAAMGTLNTEKIFQLPSKGKTLSFLLSLGPTEPGSRAVPAGSQPGPTVPSPCHQAHLRRRKLLGLGGSTSDLCHVQTVPVRFASQGTAPASDDCKDKQLHLGQQTRMQGCVWITRDRGGFSSSLACCSQPHPQFLTGSEPPALYCCL